MRLFKHMDHIPLSTPQTSTMNERMGGIFTCIYLGYMIITYIRKSVSFASPVIMEAENIEKSELGLILSSQMVGYCSGKLLGGVLADMFSPSRVFTISLLLAGITVMAFTVFDTVSMFAVLWFLNGLSQGPSWPACALLIKRWVPAEKFGTWWSVLSTSMNVSGTLGPLVSAFLLAHYSWKVSLNAVGSCAVALAGVSVMLLRDRPAEESPPTLGKSDTGSRPAVSWREGVKALVLQPVFILASINYLLVSLIRGATTDWGHLYLILEKGHSHITGSSYISSQEFGGIIGSLVAGYISDYSLSKNLTSCNPRLLVILLCTVVQSVSVFLFITTIGTASSYLWISAVGFCTGFGIFGSIALFGVVAMESTSDRLAGTAHSLISLAANIGLISSGYPLSLVAKLHSWHVAFLLVQTVAVATIIIALFCVLHSSSIRGKEKLHSG